MLITMKRHSGFTIVELLIVIVVIGIIAGIVIVGWGGLVSSSRDKAREQDVRQWAAAFDTYKSRFSVFPTLPTGDGNGGSKRYCLGDVSYYTTSYSGRCGQYTQSGQSPTKTTDAVDSTTMNTAIKKIGNLYTNGGAAVGNTFIGPMVYLYQSTSGGVVTVDAYFINFFEKACNAIDGFGDALSSSDSNYSKIYPGVNGLVSGGGLPSVNVCYYKKSLTYTPS